MEQLHLILTNIVKESGIADIIIDYKNQLEEKEKIKKIMLEMLLD